ncbi:hypothetical protein AMTR_s00076p00112190 [Amborella trichopoda]|uniref:Uncharacterized protein n=1 Tax=Amborella trichopoda TaxID=13333 RepID=W1PAI5_AMBTC|nr:hypothetical protein AMTR_s00076p00112190 [Amborella trichopoda]
MVKVEILNAMKIEYTGSIVMVEEAIGIGELNWNPTPMSKRARQNEAQRLVADLLFNQLATGLLGVTRVAKLSSSGVSDVWRFWGLGAMALCFAPSPGASGGLLIVWDPLVLAGTILFASFRILYARSS